MKGIGLEDWLAKHYKMWGTKWVDGDDIPNGDELLVLRHEVTGMKYQLCRRPRFLEHFHGTDYEWTQVGNKDFNIHVGNDSYGFIIA